MRIQASTTRFLLLVVLVAVLPAMLQTYAGIGMRIIRSGSMEPALQPGDAVIVRAVPARELVEGDIALLMHPQSDGLEAHRLVTVDAMADSVALVSKGDANPMTDAVVEVQSSATVERMLFALPHFGYVVNVFGTPMILVGLCALGLIVLIAFGMQDRRRQSVAVSGTISLRNRSA